jgi:DNA-binding MarR family transcriptional regulator
MQPLSDLDRLLENRIRLAIMAVLASGERVEFTSLRALLGTTDGNLATHLGVLERSGYLLVEKGFLGRKTHTTYSATEKGRRAFAHHVDALEQVLRGGR